MPTPTSTPEGGTDNFAGDPIAGLVYPNMIAVHQGQNRLFITSRDNNQLLKVNPADNTVVAAAATGDQPWGVVVNERTNRVYVGNFASADVWVYDADTLARIAVIRLGNPGEVQPGIMAVLPAIDTVAVIVRGLNGIAIIQGMSLEQIVGSTGAGPFGLAVDPVHNRIFVSNRDGGNMRILYRTEFGQWQNDGQNFYFGDRRVLFEVEYNPVNQKLYLLYVVDTTWSVDVWETRADGWFWKVGTVPVGQSGNSRDPNVGGMGLAVDTATGNIFVANSRDNTVSVISGTSHQVAHTLSTGPDPFHIAVNAVTRIVYVVLRQANRLAFFWDIY
jgi:YVTN family beta-propeller protein